MQVLLFVFVGILLLAVITLIVYLWDRVDALEQGVRKGGRRAEGETQAKVAGPFAGLSGKSLWEAMSGSASLDMDSSVLSDVRQRYEAVLSKHIEGLFNEGYQDARLGVDGSGKSGRVVSTLRGSVESWLPPDEAQTIYRVGFDMAKGGDEQRDELRRRLSSTCEDLYARVQIAPQRSVVESLVPAAGGTGESSET
jgi:hypothetical protein